MDKAKKQTILNACMGYVFMMVGCIAYGLSAVLFLAPNSIVAGGVLGLATLIHLLTDGKALIGVLTVLINIPIFLLGFKYVGWKFILRALITVATISVVADVMAFLPGITDNPVLASLYGGICQGIGIGLFVRCEFSSGGTELFGRLLHKWFKVGNIPVWVGILDAVIVIAGAICLQKVDNVLYALIVIFVSTKVSELILVGLEKSKMCIVITDKGEEMGKTLVERSPRGVTLMDGKGMYTNKHHDVILTCVKNRQLTQFRQIVKEVDENAFVIINESTEVRGKGFKEWDK